MQSFQDSEGRTWELAITIDAIKRVKAALPEVDLLALDDGKPPLVARLSVDVVLLCDVIFALIKPQTETKNVTNEQLGCAMGGGEVAAALKAFWGELHDFFLKLDRNDLCRIVTTQQKMLAGIVEHQDRRMAAIDLEQLIESHLSPPGNSSTGSPESSA
jgi:hypothetical protein